ncbi:MAG: hypothetical protein ABJC26_16155, partial [Gemmatimonadaceae bacterium]
MSRTHLPSGVIFALAITPALFTQSLHAQRGGGGAQPAPTLVQPPRFEYVGPDNGGRIASVAG